MHKIYLRDFYPPMDVLVYALSVFAFSLMAFMQSAEGFSVRIALYLAVVMVFLIKLLGALRLTTWFLPFVSAGQKGILIRSYFTPSRSYYWQNLSKVEIRHDRLILQQQGKKDKVYYFSALSDNQEQLSLLLKTIAPQEHRAKIG